MQAILNTARLVLRPLAAEDRPLLGEIFSGAGVRLYLFDNEEVSSKALDTIMDENLRQGKDGLGMWLIAPCRNCVIIMVSPSYFKFVKELSEDKSFLKVISLTDDQKEKQRHVEYVSRFLVHRYVDYDGKLDVEDYTDAGIVQLAEAGRTQRAGPTFVETFRLLNEAYGSNALRRFVSGSWGTRASIPPTVLWLKSGSKSSRRIRKGASGRAIHCSTQL